MSENEFTQVISSAQQRASARPADVSAHREKHSASLKAKHEVLHTVISQTLLQAWRDLETANIRATIETDSGPSGDWQISLSIPSKPWPGKLVFSVKLGMIPHLGYSVIPPGPVDEIDYTLLSDDITPVEVAQIVASYLSKSLG